MATLPSVHHLVYRSEAPVPMSVAGLQALLRQARTFNQEHHLTGLLLYSEGMPGTSSPGSFFQVLEGNELSIRALMLRICHDARHTNLQVLLDGPAPQRVFPDWAMGFSAIIPPDMDALTGHITPHEPQFPLPRTQPISSELHQLILSVLAEYPSWPYPLS